MLRGDAGGSDWQTFAAESIGDVFCDLFLLGPGVSAAKRPRQIQCRAAILPGPDSSAMSAGLDTPCAVTYGFSPRDTLTLSSLSGRRAMVALQREIIDLSGICHEQQEFVLGLPPGAGPWQLMAVTAARILLGQGVIPNL